MLGEGQVAQGHQGGDVGAEQRRQQEEEKLNVSIAIVLDRLVVKRTGIGDTAFWGCI